MHNFHDLIRGFHHFKESYFLKEREFFAQLAKAQNPSTLVIGCCDSRADPALILGCRPGDLFVVRSVAAIVPAPDQAGKADAVLAAVEYGVKHLGVKHIVVMGHSHCGGIKGLMHPHAIGEDHFVPGWVGLAQSAFEELKNEKTDWTPEELTRETEEGAVLLSIENLLSYDWIEEPVRAGNLDLHALYYDMNEGVLNVWNAQKEVFEPAGAPAAA